MIIPTVKEIRETMLILNIDPIDIATAFKISVRSAYRMISAINEPSYKDRAAVSFILYQFSKLKKIEIDLFSTKKGG